jgi:hypothetical protein
MKMSKDFWIETESEAPTVVDHPGHYNKGEIEAIEVIEDWNLDFHCGNVVKYIARHKHKKDASKDIEKALWYLERYLDKLNDRGE